MSHELYFSKIHGGATIVYEVAIGLFALQFHDWCVARAQN